MSLQVKKKFIESNAVDEAKIRLSNNASLRARNAADNADVDILKLNASNEIEFTSIPKFGASNVATEQYVADEIAALGALFVYKGEYNASTNTPALSDATGTAGNVYRVNVAGTQDFGSGNITFEVGDKAAYREGVWVKWDVIDNEFSTSDTDDLAEGVTNLYHTVARARTAAVVNSTAGAETDQASSVAAMKSYVAAEVATAGSELEHQEFSILAGDITAGYVTLAGTPVPGSVVASLVGAPGLARNGTDFTMVSGNRLTWAGSLGSLIESGDILTVYYQV